MDTDSDESKRDSATAEQEDEHCEEIKSESRHKRAFTLAQWLYRCSSVQVTYSPSSSTASKVTMIRVSLQRHNKTRPPYAKSKPQTKM